jgi:hypothetical protein
VTDRARLFSWAPVRQVEEALRAWEREKGWQVVVETVDSLDGQDIEAGVIAEAQSRKVRGLFFLISNLDLTGRSKGVQHPSGSDRSSVGHPNREYGPVSTLSHFHLCDKQSRARRSDLWIDLPDKRGALRQRKVK